LALQAQLTLDMQYIDRGTIPPVIASEGKQYSASHPPKPKYHHSHEGGILVAGLAGMMLELIGSIGDIFPK
jgi:hypothetical protein